MTKRPFYLFLFQFSFESDMTSSCTPFIIYIEEAPVEKNSVIIFCYLKINNIVVKNLFKFMFGVWPSGHNLQMFRIFRFWLFVSGQVDASITYYRTMQYQDFCHFRLKPNTIAYIYLFSIYQSHLYWLLKDITISIDCVSGADILNAFGFLLPQLPGAVSEKCPRFCKWLIFWKSGFPDFRILWQPKVNSTCSMKPAEHGGYVVEGRRYCYSVQER